MVRSDPRLSVVSFGFEEAGGLRIRGAVPEAFLRRFPELGETEDLGEVFPFLENFVIDAMGFWASQAAGSLNSGPWAQDDAAGEPCELEATATWEGTHRVVLMQFLGAEFREVRGILQAARDQSLTIDALEKIQAKLQGSERRLKAVAEERRHALELLEAGRSQLEDRVRERTAALVATNSRLQQANERLVEYQDQLRLLAEQLAIVEEKERRRIAAYLHDQVGQGLAMVKLKLGMMSREVDSPHIEELSKIVEGIVADTRTMTFELATPVLYELGLEAALETLAARVAERTGVRIAFEDDHAPKDTTHHVRSVLYQAVNELLHNAVKHAKASRIEVRVHRDGDAICVDVVDDGRGFDVAALEYRVTASGGFGLFNIRERLAHLGGKLELDSLPGTGTRALVRGPLAQPS